MIAIVHYSFFHTFVVYAEIIFIFTIFEIFMIVVYRLVICFDTFVYRLDIFWVRNILHGSTSQVSLARTQVTEHRSEPKDVAAP